MIYSEKSRILMIDEAQYILDFTRELCKQHFNVEFYSMNHPRLGIQVAARRLPKLLISEIYFPKSEYFNGEYLIHAVRELCPGIKIMICSTIDDEPVITRFLEGIGVDAYLKKPFDLNTFFEKVSELINEPYSVGGTTR